MGRGREAIMVRKARNGIVYPYRVERRKRLSDGTVKIYTSYEFKVDGKTYSCKNTLTPTSD